MLQLFLSIKLATSSRILMLWLKKSLCGVLFRLAQGHLTSRTHVALRVLPKASKDYFLQKQKSIHTAGADPVGRTIGRSPLLKTYESNFIHNDFVQFRKQHSRLKAILSSIVLSQQYCDVCFISLGVAKPLWDLTTRYYWNRPLSPKKIIGCIHPCHPDVTFKRTDPSLWKCHG